MAPAPMVAPAPRRAYVFPWELLERAKGFEPSTPTLARLCSTPELHPHPRRVSRQTGPKTRAVALLCQRATGLATIARPAYETVNARLAGRPFRLPRYAGYRPQDRHPSGGLYRG